ncbi:MULTISPECIES: DUF4184 family protein [unclassified Gilliamella]|uniref:DUF4184 family protein n=1 Tax=unclassified Gilliamella TaxID=2685620 RepID=UPI0013234079|nr:MULTISPECIES: DUF4184 family protein [unclassified Gilliamella]MWN32906.1 DUF4184 family protein [Gilliamella sp. Pra-s60]MWP30354.1 DUF4184 family protein [Gilliamella sp. Pra-s54]MWP47713.1 DUF4184 family protein [Gilliamella sp. Pas-s27]
MPFTFAHPAIVLPFYKKTKFFSMTTLIIGSMSPDFEYFLRMKIKSDMSHTLLGIFYFDLPITLIVAFIFHSIIRNELIKNLPHFLYKRFAHYLTLNWKQYCLHHWFIVLTSALIGILSHIGWDSFTHLTGFFVKHLPFLQQPISLKNTDIPIYQLLQHGSTLVGMSLICIFILRLPIMIDKKNTISFLYWGLVMMIVISCFSLFFTKTIHTFGQNVVNFINALFLGLILAPPIMRITRRLF